MGCHLQRSLSAQVDGGPDANTDRGKQAISAARISGGFPGNVLYNSHSRACHATTYQRKH